jgi:PAS domain S-box-containing protein
MNGRIKYVIVVSAILFMSFLFAKTKSIDINKHNQLLHKFNQFMLIDSILNQNILEIRQGLLTFYDPTVGKINQLKQLTLDIESILNVTQKENLEQLTPLLNKSINAIALKNDNIEKFKSTNAIFTNSLRYLPTATNQLASKLPLDSQGDVVTLLLIEQLRDILIHNYSNDNIILDKFNKTNKLLISVFKNHYRDLLNELNSLQSHANVVVENKLLIDEIVNEILNTPTSGNMNKLLDTYHIIHNRKMHNINRYQQALYSLSVFLLIYLAYILYQLNITGKNLKNTIKDLNSQKFAMDQHAIVSVTDNEGIITYANQKFLDITGYTSSEVTGKTHAIVKSNYHPDSFFEKLKNTGKSGEVWHGIIRNKNKYSEYYWVDTTCVPFINEDGNAYQFVTIQTNITEIKDAQEKLHLQSTALEVAANGIVITDINANILWTNKAFSEITGYEPDEITGQTLKLLNSGKQDADFFKTMWNSILNGQSWHGELINRRKDGSLYPEELTIAPVFNSPGKISHFVSIKQDISKRQLTEEALRRSQKMDAIGQLSGGIAHDFNNQLGIVLGYLDILKNNVSENDQSEKYITTATKATLRCIELTRQLLAFSHKQTTETTNLKLNDLLTDQKTIISRSITPEITLIYNLSNELWLTNTHSGEFQDAILNIAINARDAMPGGGTLTVKTCNQTFDEACAENINEILAGEYVLVTISDTGMGMDKKTQEHIFEPFFTTKPLGKGTGLGMAMVYGFVNRYKGYINIHSELNIGTTIGIYLPRSNSANNPVSISTESEPLPGGNETILIVDDETDLLDLTNKHLQNLGYKTYTAENAQQALRILSSKPDIKLLFSDIIMPGGINGFELAEKATLVNPSIKVILTSGFTSKNIIKKGAQQLSSSLLIKPYRKKELAEKIRSTLDNSD